MKLRIAFWGLLLFWVVWLSGCGPSHEPVAPTPTPDRPSWTEREAIAVVQNWLALKQVGWSNCLRNVQLLGGSGNTEGWTGKYQSAGEWLVTYGEVAGWSVFENTQSILLVTGKKRLASVGC